MEVSENHFIKNHEDPILEFQDWFELAQNSGNFESTAVNLSTVGSDQMPSSRMVLLKKFNHRGFFFFTNYESLKAQEILKNPKACLCFHWEKPFHRQIRVQGFIEKTSRLESENYFNTRSRESRIGAWASPQSQSIKNRNELMEKYRKMEKKFSTGKIPCPPHWGGFRLNPLSIEFWQSGDFRLHHRKRFIRKTSKTPWEVDSLAP